MITKGKVQNGVTVLPPDVHFPEGVEVNVETIETQAELEFASETDPFLKAVVKVTKPRPDWPEDYALNHGHYTSVEPRSSDLEGLGLLFNNFQKKPPKFELSEQQ